LGKKPHLKQEVGTKGVSSPQIKGGIPMEKFNYFIGIDVSKDNFVVSIKSSPFIHTNLTFSMDKSGFEKFLLFTSKFKDSSICVLEPTGTYHTNLFNFLKTNGYNVSIVNPYKVKQFSKVIKNKPTKTDKIDSKILAKFVEFTQEIGPSIPEEKENFRHLIREKELISKQIAKIKAHIKALLYMLFPELARNENIFSRGIISILKIFPSASCIRNIPEEKFISCAKKYLPKIGKKQDLKTIYQLAKNSIAYSYPHHETLLKMKIEHFEFLEKQKQEITKIIEQLADKIYKREIEILTSIPGIAKSSAIYFIGEIMEIKRFKNAKKLIGYCGLDLVIKQSGTYKGKWKISKRGNSHVRRIAFIMASSVRKHSLYFKEYYEKKRNEGKSHIEAVIATSTKLLRVIYSLLFQDRIFN
jgi:transposase